VQAIASLLGGFYQGAWFAVWQPFALHLYDSVRFLGLLESVGGFRTGLVSAVMLLLGGWMADRVGRKPTLLLASLSTLLSMLFYTLAAALHSWTLLIPGAILTGMGMLGVAARNSTTAESVREERRGAAYSWVLFAATAPGIVSSIVGGAVAERWGYLPIMGAGLVFEALILLTLIVFLRETSPRDRRQNRQGGWQSLLRLLKIPKSLWPLAIPFFVDALFFGIARALLFGILHDQFGFTDGQLGWINALFFLSWAIAQLPIGWLIDRYGCKRFLIIGETLTATSVLMWLLWPSFAGVAAAFVVLGLSASLWVPALMKLVASSVPEEERGEGMGRIFTVQGIARIPGPFVAAQLYEWGGYSVPLLVGLGGIVSVVVLIAVLIQDPPARPAEAGAGTGD
jgi:MFS family permease